MRFFAPCVATLDEPGNRSLAISFGFRPFVRRRATSTQPHIPPSAAKNSAEGSGTAAGLPLKPAVGANAAVDATVDAESIALLSTANRPESLSASGDESVEDKIDELGNAARTRLSKRLTSRPGSVAASRSIAAMRFSSCWPLTLVIEPAAIASWMAASGSRGAVGRSAAAA